MASRAALKKFVYENKTMTFNDLKNLVLNIKNLDGKSKVSPTVSRRYVIEDIFIPFFESLERKDIDLDSVVNTTMFISRNKLTLTPNGIIMLNILTECGYTPK